MEKITREAAIEKSLEYFNGDRLAAEVFVDKYALRTENGLLEETPNDMHRRLAKEFARIESKYPNSVSEETFFGLMEHFKKIVPQGSPMAGVGNDTQIMSVSNCFVIGSPEDSYGGILKTDQEQAQLMKRRAGVGFDISNIRPKGMATKNAARTTDGIGVFMERFSSTCREVAQNGRRGALMLSIDIRHPEVETFVTIKNDKKKVTGANISVKITDDFMQAVKNDEEYIQQWPVDSKNPSIVKKVKARPVWDLIIKNAWMNAEPGILFWDKVKSNGPADAYPEYTSTSTNPCGEITLSPYDSCRLIALNVLGFVTNPYTKESSFDFQEFKSNAYIAQRMMDDLIDIELEKINEIIHKIDSDPESENIKRVEKELWLNVKKACVNGRRTGLGVTAIGDALAAMGIVYGTSESITFVEEIYKTLAIGSYMSSIDMAEERGAFPVYDYDIEKNHAYISKIINELPSEYQNKYKQFGRRNIALTTTAPTGSVSILTQTSSGIEPVFRLFYERRKKINPDSNDQTFNYVDVMGDKWQVFKVYHHELKKWMEINKSEDISKSPWYGGTSEDVDWVKSVDIQAAAQRWVDHSISKTCNLPNDVSESVVSDVYMRAWESGCKGFTVYRDGCRDGVLVTESQKKTETFEQKDAPKRPEVLDCDIHRMRVESENWIIIVGKYEGKPYETFAGLSKFISIPKKIEHGKLVKRESKKKNGSSIYDLYYGDETDPTIIKDIVKTFENPTQGEFTRLVSLALRHGAPVHFLTQQLQKDEESDMYSFSKVIARVLKTYIADGVKVKNKCSNCGSDQLVYQEGCLVCLSCGHGKCG